MISFINEKIRLLIKSVTGFEKKLAQANLVIKFSGKDISKKTHIFMEEKSTLGRIEVASVSFKIGAYSFFRSGVVSSDLTIGRFCSLGENIHIGVSAQAHPAHWVSTNPFQYDQSFKNTPIQLTYKIAQGETSIGNDVWIGEGVLIMEGVSIGDGIPARFIRQRFPESTAKELLDTQWWNYSLDNMVGFSFDKPQEFIKQFNMCEMITTDYKIYSVVRGKRNLKVRELV